MLRWRHDKPVEEADTLGALQSLLATAADSCALRDVIERSTSTISSRAQRRHATARAASEKDAGGSQARGGSGRERRDRQASVRRSCGAQLTLPSADGWFAAHGWQPFEFQREVWRHIAEGRSGLLHATTGSGKTYAVWFALLNRALAGEVHAGALRLLWLTPMRALAADTARALAAPLNDLGLAWQVGVRTGDTDSAERARQSKHLPEVLITTPESLSLMLTRADSREQLSDLAMIVVDEWHELIGSKRGVQVQLALARLRRWARKPLPVWGLSATLGQHRACDARAAQS